MTSKVLQGLGLLGLLLFAGTGVATWALVKQRVQVTVLTGESAKGDDGLALLRDEVQTLSRDLRALREGFTKGLERTFENLADVNAKETAQALGALETRIGVRLDTLARALESARTPAAIAAAPPGPALPESRPESAPASVPASVPVPAQRKRGSFLAFDIPTDDVRFDARNRFEVVASLSRVGFDAKSTLHDFTGATTEVSGEIETNLADPATGSRGRIRARVEALDTGLADRNTAMFEHLDSKTHPNIAFELDEFVPTSVDPKSQKIVGTARGSMTIRGKARPFAIPVRAQLDESRRLCIEGEQTLKLTEFEVPLPNKLGLIKMEDEVRVWIALRLRKGGAAK